MNNIELPLYFKPNNNDLDLYFKPYQTLEPWERENIQTIANSKHKGEKRQIGGTYGCSKKQMPDFFMKNYRVCNISLFSDKEVINEYNATGYKDECGESTWEEEYPIYYALGNKRIYDLYHLHSTKYLAYFNSADGNSSGIQEIMVIIFED